MKSFKQLIEAKDRFIKKNKNLTPEQQEEMIKFFRMNGTAEGKVDWQRSHKMTYNDFLDIKLSFKSGRKGDGKSSKITCQTKLSKGLKPMEDYVHLKLKSKEYCAYIPLSWDTAQQFNKSSVLGACSGDWCIGSSINNSQWRSHILRQQEVPIYIVNAKGDKWVVMIKKNNSSLEVWDIKNTSPDGTIDSFDVRKELLQDAKKKKLYNEVREIYKEEVVGVEKLTELKNRIYNGGAELSWEGHITDTSTSAKWVLDNQSALEAYRGGTIYIEGSRVNITNGNGRGMDLGQAPTLPSLEIAISRSKLHNCSMQSYNMESCTITGDKSKYSICTLEECVIYDGGEFSNCHIKEAKEIYGVVMTGGMIWKGLTKYCNIKDVTVRDSKIMYSELDSSYFSKCDISDCKSIYDCDLEDCEVKDSTINSNTRYHGMWSFIDCIDEKGNSL